MNLDLGAAWHTIGSYWQIFSYNYANVFCYIVLYAGIPGTGKLVET